MDKHWQPNLVIGMFLLVLVVILFLYRPQPNTEGTYVRIDNSWSKATANARFVKTTVDLGQQDQLDNFPSLIGEWQGTDQDASGVKGRLGANVLLMRVYRKSSLSQPVFLLIMQSRKTSSFHSPPVCYRALKYAIEKETKDKLFVKDTSWVREIKDDEVSKSLFARLETPLYRVWVPTNKLVVFKKKDNGEIIERRVVLYFYIRGVPMSNDEIGMVRVSALIPTSGPYDDTLRVAKEFMGEVVPLMFEPREESKKVMASLVELGIGGYFIILLLLSIPVTVIIYPILVARRSRRLAHVAEPTSERTRDKEETKVAGEGDKEVQREVQEKIVLGNGDSGNVINQLKRGSESKPGERENNTLPPSQTHDLVDENGRGRILRAYYNSLRIIEKATGTSAESRSTLREFLEDVKSALPTATVNSLTELTKIAEAATYSALQPDENIVLWAEQLAGVIIKELDNKIV